MTKQSPMSFNNQSCIEYFKCLCVDIGIQLWIVFLNWNCFNEFKYNFFLCLCLWFDIQSFISIWIQFHSSFQIELFINDLIYSVWNTLLKKNCLFSISNWLLMSDYPSWCISIRSRNIWKHLCIGLTSRDGCVSKLLVHRLVGLSLINSIVGLI